MNGLELLGQRMEEVSLMTDIEEQADGKMDAVKLMSIHASKGLEFPIVFVVGVEENVFPLSKAQMDPHELEEERRLMYVAITRAKDHLFLSHANARRQRGQTKYNEASRFLGEIPEELRKHYDLSGGGSTIKSPSKSLYQEGDWIQHKLFGEGEVIEVRGDMLIVKFANPKSGIRKMESKFVTKLEKTV